MIGSLSILGNFFSLINSEECGYGMLNIYSINLCSDKNDKDSQENEVVVHNDPSAPVTRRGILTSFLTGKVIEIPDEDSVIFYVQLYIFEEL